ncbi:MAG: LrgB family protein [Eubacteriales bacterium]
MNQLFANSLTIGVVLSLVLYSITDKIHQKYKNPLLSPIILTTAIIILILVLGDVEYESFQYSAKYLDYLLTPTTVCLAIPLYQKLEVLKKNYKAIIAGVISGSLAGMCTILGFAMIFGLTHEEYVTMLPKSVTTAIAIGITNEL